MYKPLVMVSVYVVLEVKDVLSVVIDSVVVVCWISVTCVLGMVVCDIAADVKISNVVDSLCVVAKPNTKIKPFIRVTGEPIK